MCAFQLFAAAERLREQMRVAEAVWLYDQAEQAGYDADQCGAARWTCYMLGGEWERAWLESDRIARRGGPDPHRYWNGGDWAGKHVLIRCLHGLGDTLQFIRYVPLVRERARSVTVEAQPKLKNLLQISGVADRVITWGEAEPPWQIQMEVNELPRIFRTNAGNLPCRVPYLRSPKAVKRAGADGKLRVGLVWTASSFDTSRNVPLQLLHPLLEIPDVRLCSLQAGEGWTESMPQGLISRSGAETSIEQIADEMNALDLILTVDTMNAHLAGALGCRTWTMLPFQCDWRWMMDRESTPWYPTMRLFRQPSPDNWEAVVAHLRSALAYEAAAAGSVKKNVVPIPG